MEQEHERGSKAADVNPVGTSLVGGFLGTVTGLRKGGVGGAVIGGLVGGTAGYVAGAAADASPSPTADEDVESITISTDNDDEDDGDEPDTDAHESEATHEGSDRACERRNRGSSSRTGPFSNRSRTHEWVLIHENDPDTDTPSFACHGRDGGCSRRFGPGSSGDGLPADGRTSIETATYFRCRTSLGRRYRYRLVAFR